MSGAADLLTLKPEIFDKLVEKELTIRIGSSEFYTALSFQCH
jgi:hypothetical protein